MQRITGPLIQISQQRNRQIAQVQVLAESRGTGKPPGKGIWKIAHGRVPPVHLLRRGPKILCVENNAVGIPECERECFRRMEHRTGNPSRQLVLWGGAMWPAGDVGTALARVTPARAQTSHRVGAKGELGRPMLGYPRESARLSSFVGRQPSPNRGQFCRKTRVRSAEAVAPMAHVQSLLCTRSGMSSLQPSGLGVIAQQKRASRHAALQSVA